MISLVPYLVSLLTGWLILSLIVKPSCSLPFSLRFFLSWGLGLGASANLSFYSLLFWGQFHGFVVLLAHVLFLLALFALSPWNCRTFFMNIKALKKDWRKCIWPLLMTGFFLEMIVLLYIMTRLYPYGYWDAWAVWNMKTKFLLQAGPAWTNIFKLNSHTQPDYPLLLPLLNAWGCAFNANTSAHAARLTAVAFTFTTGGLLFAGLRRFCRVTTALLAAGLLYLLPAFIISGISQYADILVAYYILAIVITMILGLKDNDRSFLFLSGLLCGLLSFTKNEGIILAIIFAVMVTVYLLKREKNPARAVPALASFFGGTMLTFVPVLIFKLKFAPLNPDILTGPFQSQLHFFNLPSVFVVIRSCLLTMLDPHFAYIWGLLFLMFLSRPKDYFIKEMSVISWSLIGYAGAVLLIYLLTVHFDLSWRLSRTLPRILTYLLPSLLFCHFYVHGYSPREKKQ